VNTPLSFITSDNSKFPTAATYQVPECSYSYDSVADKHICRVFYAMRRMECFFNTYQTNVSAL